jgi:hypothetical protein
MLYRIARGGYSGGDPDLAINRGQMRVDGAGTDDQALSHLLIGQSLCHDAPLDVLSGGRAWLGIGAGDYEEEAVGSGLPFPPLKERYERLEEMLQICLLLGVGGSVPRISRHVTSTCGFDKNRSTIKQGRISKTSF